ncbi:MAG: hypothetical protein FWC70_07865 [Defluviitaleaceae bacterium]|nr:hypothetical protein [Defluviitaleaceae bacterium]
MNTRVKRFSDCIGEIDDVFLEEAVSEDFAALLATRKRRIRYGALAAIASVGVAVVIPLTLRIMKARRMVNAA